MLLMVVSGFGHDRERMLDWTWRFQQLWVGFFFDVVRVLLGLKVEVEGEECVRPGPVIVLIRHASIVDNLLPSVFVANRERIRLRYVLKRELLWDPCLDIVGNRLPNLFVDRGGQDSERARRAVAELAQHLEPNEGVLIYPEGTRFSAEKQEALRLRYRVWIHRGDAEQAGVDGQYRAYAADWKWSITDH